MAVRFFRHTVAHADGSSREEELIGTELHGGLHEAVRVATDEDRQNHPVEHAAYKASLSEAEVPEDVTSAAAAPKAPRRAAKGKR